VKSTNLLAIVGVSMALASCASDGPGLFADGDPLDYDSYDAAAYGPFHDGYWMDGGAFYSRDHPGRAFIADGGDRLRDGSAGRVRGGRAGGTHGVRVAGSRGGHAGGGKR